MRKNVNANLSSVSFSRVFGYGCGAEYRYVAIVAALAAV